MAVLLLAVLVHFLSNFSNVVLADVSNVVDTFEHNNEAFLNIALPNDTGEFTESDAARENDASCNQYIHNFSISSSSFVQCATSHAKPVELCEKCSAQYSDVISAADDVEKDKSCRDKILNSDILRIVHTTHKFVTDLWTNGQCDSCYIKQSASPEGRPAYDEFSNETVNFLVHYNATQECFNHSLTVSEVFELDTDNPVCRDCNMPYCALNKLYENMGAASTICIDIVEMMNSTRHTWSADFKCIKHTKNLEEVVVSVSAFLSCLPVIFYLAAKILSAKKVITREDLSKSGGSGDEHYISTFGANRR